VVARARYGKEGTVKLYLAARYSRNEEMRGYRDDLVRRGHVITSRWIDKHGGDLSESVAAEKLNTQPGEVVKYAVADCEDLNEADVIISFTSKEGGGKGGRHIEFGLGLAMGKRTIVVGPRENIFHTLPVVEWYPNWGSFIRDAGMGFPK